MKKLKQLIISLIVAVLFFENVSPVLAAPVDVAENQTTKEVLRGGVKYSPVTLKELFDANYYLMLYPELRAIYGDDAELLYQHFITYGLAEGRKCSPYLDIAKYMANNTDLLSVFGQDFDSFVAHYFSYGINEGRNAYASALDLSIQKKLEKASNIYINGRQDSEAIKTLYGLAYLETSISQENYTSSSVPSNDDSDSSKKDSKIIISDDVIAIPWDYVENGYVTLEMIKAHCGDNLILVQNSNNDVTFIAGDISSRNVSDKDSVLEAVQSFFGILNYPSDTCYLYLGNDYVDSVGNHIYRFQSRDSATDITSNKILDANMDLCSAGSVTGTVILKTDKNGNIIGLSSSSNDTFDTFEYSTYDPTSYIRYSITDRRYNMKKLNVDQVASVLSKDYEVLSYLPQEFESIQAEPRPYYKFFVKKDGNIYMMCVCSEQDIKYSELLCTIYPIDESVYLSTETPGEKSQPYDNLYSNVEVTYRKFIDSNGREVSLPVARDENGYYFCAPEYRLILETDPVETEDYDTQIRYGLGLYYIDIDNPDIDAVTIFSNMYEACKTYYEHTGSYNVLPTLMAEYAPNFKVENAFGQSDFAISYMTYCGYKPFIKDTSTSGHESTHAYQMEGSLIGVNYVKFMAAMAEGYADIVGIITQQKILEDYLKSESEKTGKSIDDVYNELLESKKWLIDKDDWYSGAAYLEDGTPTWLYKASDPVGSSMRYGYAEKVGGENFVEDGIIDSYGCHINSSILSHIAYEMWKNDVESDYDKLLDIWYDTCYMMTGESSFYDVRNYIEASMKEKEYSQDKIDKTMEFFDQANITKETQDFMEVSDVYEPENFYSDEYINKTGVYAELDIDELEAPPLEDLLPKGDSDEDDSSEESDANQDAEAARAPKEEPLAVNDSIEDSASENDLGEATEVVPEESSAESDNNQEETENNEEARVA